VGDKLVDIRRLKQWANTNLQKHPKLREIILLDQDQLTPEQYLTKLDIWLKLYNIESNADD
jgi:hypothetical protein